MFILHNFTEKKILQHIPRQFSKRETNLVTPERNFVQNLSAMRNIVGKFGIEPFMLYLESRVYGYKGTVGKVAIVSESI